MKEAAAALDFEKAARLRDGIKALMILQNQNIVESFDSEDRDYIAHYSEGELVSFTVLKVRGGKLLGRENYRVESLPITKIPNSCLQAFLFQQKLSANL